MRPPTRNRPTLLCSISLYRYAQVCDDERTQILQLAHFYSKITVFDIMPPGSWDHGIRNSPIPNPGIEKTGPGLESLSVLDTARLKRSATNSDDQLSDGQQQSTPSQKKPRVFFTEHQKASLREAFQRDSYPNQATLERLASELGVGTKTVVNWFHNHRMRAKQQQQVCITIITYLLTYYTFIVPPPHVTDVINVRKN